MKKLIFLYVLLCLTASCASMPGHNRDALQDQLNAENRLMKKNSELALRENEVLKSENAQYKSEVKKLNETVQQLTDDLGSLHEKYDEDIAIANEAYEDLCAYFTILEFESDEKIQTLTESYAALEKQFSDEVARLNQDLNQQQESFQTERNSLQSGFESKINELEGLLSSSMLESTEKDKKIEALEKDQQEDRSRIISLEKTADDQSEKIKQSEIKYQEMTLSSQQLQKDIEEKQAIIGELSAKLKAMQDSTEQTINK